MRLRFFYCKHQKNGLLTVLLLFNGSLNNEKDVYTKNMLMNLSKQDRGFTLLEIIMMLVIIGVLVFTVASRLTNTSSLSAETAAVQVESYIRYIQAKAMSTQTPTSIAFASDGGGWYFTMEQQKYHIPKGSSLSLSGNITFNSFGEPVPPIGSVTVGGVSITATPVTGKVKRQ